MSHLKQGFQINEEYVRTMERMTGAKSRAASETTIHENEASRRRSPTFVSVPQGSALSFEEAARILRLPAAVTPNNPDADVAAQEKAPRVLQHDPFERNRRHAHIVTDTSVHRDPAVRRVSCSGAYWVGFRSG